MLSDTTSQRSPWFPGSGMTKEFSAHCFVFYGCERVRKVDLSVNPELDLFWFWLMKNV